MKNRSVFIPQSVKYHQYSPVDFNLKYILENYAEGGGTGIWELQKCIRPFGFSSYFTVIFEDPPRSRPSLRWSDNAGRPSSGHISCGTCPETPTPTSSNRPPYNPKRRLFQGR